MRLLNRTIISYLIYSILVFLTVTPVFYYMINWIFIKEVDETLLSKKNEIQFKAQKIKSDEELRIWENLDEDIRIAPLTGGLIYDSIYFSSHYDSLSREVEPYRVLSTVIEIGGKSYNLVVRVSLLESEDLIKALSITQAVVLFVLLMGLLFINWRLSKIIWKPFYHTLEELKKFDVEKANPLTLIDTRVKEFKDLNSVIRHLSERNYKTFVNQKEFTENAAHEMQTPLAVFKSKLELLMQTHPTEEQAKLIESLNDATSRLARLNRALLLLSKIDNRQFLEVEPVNVGDLTDRIISHIQPEIDAKGISILIDRKTSVVVNFNNTLIEVMLSNLIHNAIRYSPRNTEIRIVITKRQWEISNMGNPLNFSVEKVFERFQKGNNDSSSTGLGLAIAKKICDTNGLKIGYDFDNNHHVFRITY
jgi:signal transduction histidine kinase